MKKLVILMLFGCFIFSSCYNRRNGRTSWSKAPVKEVKADRVKPS